MKIYILHCSCEDNNLKMLRHLFQKLYGSWSHQELSSKLISTARLLAAILMIISSVASGLNIVDKCLVKI
jgi:hypothetical protein